MKKRYYAKVIRTTVYTSKLNAISYVVVNILLTIALVSSGVLYDSLSDFMTKLHNSRIPVRTLMVSQYEKNQTEDEIANRIQSVSPYILSVVHQSSTVAGGEITSLASENLTGDVMMLGCDQNTMPALTSKIDFSMSENFCIIPERFYPDSLVDNINKDHYIDGTEYIGKELTLTIDVDHFNGTEYIIVDQVDFKIRVVGTYDAEAIYNNDNVCYIPFSLVRECYAASNDGTISDDPDDHPMFAYLDDVEHVDAAIHALEEKGYHVKIQEQLNDRTPEMIKSMMNKLCIALYGFAFLISAALLLGMVNKAKIKIALLKSIGFSDTFILKLFIHGYGILLILGYFIGLCFTAMAALIIRFSILDHHYYFSKMDIIWKPLAAVAPILPLLFMPLAILVLVTIRIRKISPIELWKE